MNDIRRYTRQAALFSLALLPGFCAGTDHAGASTLVPDFASATFLPGTAIDNPYFPLSDGTDILIRAEGVDEDGEAFEESSRLRYGGPGPEILGVNTTIQHDQAFEGDLLVEETFDYYAQDSAGNVWYMGEDVTNYIYDDDGDLIETNNASAWLAGQNDALPGFIMPASPAVDFAYFQEVAPNDAALDEAVIWAMGETVTSGGITYDDVLITLETTQLDPDAREFKFYAPGQGLIRVEEGLDATFANPELVFERVAVSPVPLPAGLPMLAAALAVLMGLMRWRRA